MRLRWLRAVTVGCVLAAGSIVNTAPGTRQDGSAVTADQALDRALEEAQTLLNRARRAEQGAEDLAQLRRQQQDQVVAAVKVLLASPGVEDSGRACTLLDQLATEAVQTQDWLTARNAWEFVVSFRERHAGDTTDVELLPQARHNLAIAHFQVGDRDWGLGAMEEVVCHYEQHPPRDRKEDIKARNDLALMLTLMDRLHRAQIIQEQVLTEVEAMVPQSERLINLACRNLALTLLQVGDLSRSEQLMHRAYDERPGLTPSATAQIEMQWGQLLLAQGHKDAAIRRFRAGASALEGFPADHLTRVDCELNLARALTETGEAEEAVEVAEGVLAALRASRGEGDAAALLARRVLAHGLWRTGENKPALEHLRTRLHSFEERGASWHPDALHSRCNLASALAREERWEELDAQLDILERDLHHWIDHSLTLAPREARERAHLCDRFLAVVLSLRTLADGDERAELAAFDLEETFRAIATDGVRLGPDAWTDPALTALRGEIQQQNRRLSDLISGLDLEQEGRRPSVEQIQHQTDRRDQLERRYLAAVLKSGQVTASIDALELAEALPENSVAVAFRRLPILEPGTFLEDLRPEDDQFVAFVVRSDLDDTIDLLPLGDADTVDQWISEWRGAINRSTTRGVSAEAEDSDRRADELGARIRERILDPVLAAAGEARRLYLCLDSTLHLLPLDALPLGRGRVGDDYRILHQTSFASLVRPRPKLDGPARLLVIGDPDYFAGMTEQSEVPDEAVAPALRAITGGRLFVPLSGTREEATQVADLFQRRFGDEAVMTLLGEAATKRAVEADAAGARYLHLATHGYVTRSATLSTLDSLSRGASTGADVAGLGTAIRGLAPLNLCGIALAGANAGASADGHVRGILSATELSSLDLSQCELAVLSACETNVGIHRSGLGIQSLQSALHAAGVRSTITSLWEVPDQETHELMTAFYSALWLGHANKAEALWEAKKSLRSQGAHLVDWAGWTLAGDVD